MTFKYCDCDRLFFRIPKEHVHDHDGYHWQCPTCGETIHREEGVIEPSLIKTFTWAFVLICLNAMI